jgi:ParB family chromosome partitioning protein
MNTSTPKHYEFTIIQIDQLIPFKDHAFIPYDEKRIKPLRVSIEKNGIIHPIVVRPLNGNEEKDKFEIVSGHNRVEAAKLAGLTEVPAVIKELTDDEAVMLSNEANLQSRNFSTWLPSEKIKSIHQYHETVKNQGSRSDLQSETSGDSPKKLNAREKTALVYGQSDEKIKVYLELHKLIDELQQRLDRNKLGITAASEICFIPEEGQKLINPVLGDSTKGYEVTVKRSKKLRDYFENRVDKSRIKEDRELLKDGIRLILTETEDDDTDTEKSDDTVKISIPKDKYEELFPENPSTEKIVGYIIKAIEKYRNQDEGGL